MYLISGTIFVVASFYIFLAGNIIKRFYSMSNEPLFILLSLISFFLGLLFYYLHYQALFVKGKNDTTNNSSTNSHKNVETIPLTINEYEIIHFFNEKDRNLYIDNTINKDTYLSKLDRQKITILETCVLKNQCLGYNSITPQWSFVSAYNINRGDNMLFSTSISMGGLNTNINLSITSIVTATLPADPSRASRLSASVDITVERIRIDGYVNGVLIYSYEALKTVFTSDITNFIQYS